MSGISSRSGTWAMAKQSAKGTAASAPTVKMFFAGAPTIMPVKNRADYSLTDSTRDRQGSYTSMLAVQGNVPLYLNPDAAAFIFAASLGAVADTGSDPNYS